MDSSLYMKGIQQVTRGMVSFHLDNSATGWSMSDKNDDIVNDYEF